MGYVGLGLSCLGFRLSQKQGYHFGSPHKKDYTILGSILRLPL